MEQNEEEGVRRVSISLLPDVHDSLDRLTEQRGFKSRSQAVSEMITQSITSNISFLGNDVVAGTITLIYDEARPGLLESISKIQRRHVNEVLSSQHILLENNHMMEVIVAQGPAKLLREITDELITCKGVRSGTLVLTTLILPPIHPLPEDTTG